MRCSERNTGLWLSPLQFVAALMGVACAGGSSHVAVVDAQADAGAPTTVTTLRDASADAVRSADVVPDASAVPDAVPYESYAAPTTDPSIAVSNLSSQIESYAELLRLSPQNTDIRRALVSALLARTAFLGSYSDFDRAFEALDPWPAMDDWEATLAKARLLNAVHRFAEARSLVQKMPASAGLYGTDLLETINIATGASLDEVYDSRKAKAAQFPSFSTLAGSAAAAAALGLYNEADELYRKALAAYPDVSPFPVAFVYFQRGVMWGEMADRPARARGLYQEAVRLLPQYVVANVHLAELEAQDGMAGHASALARLRRVSAQTEDPEPTGLLGELLLAQGDPEAATLIAKAAAGYRDLLSRHRAAFADHASEFFAGPGGDPQFALELALENVALRPTPRAYIVAIGAAESARQLGKLCELAAAAMELPAPSQSLRVVIGEVAHKCR